MPTKQSVVLLSLQRRCIAGGAVQGEIELDFSSLQVDGIERVEVRLGGVLQTRINVQNSLAEQTLSLVRENVILWRRGSAYPPPGTHTLRLPFSIMLPTSLPPTFNFKVANVSGSVLYDIEVVGVRSGVFRFNKNLPSTALIVVPADPAGKFLKSQLQQGWDGAWTTTVETAHVGWGIFGGSATAEISVHLPSIPYFPILAPVPFSITINSLSKPMRRTDRSEDKPIFPSPPRDAQHIKFELRRIVYVRANRREAMREERVPFSSGLTQSNPAFHRSALQQHWEPLPTDPEKGTWAQEITYNSAFELACSPTFEVPHLRVRYFLHVKVKFSGLFNNVDVIIPIVVVSGVVPSSTETIPPSYGAQDGEGLPIVSPPEYTPPPPSMAGPSIDTALSLPPSYQV